MRWAPLALLLSWVMTAACQGKPAGGATDAGADAAPDMAAEAAPDTATDAGADAAPDTATDAGADAAPWAWKPIPNERILFFSRRDKPSGYGETYLLGKDGKIVRLLDNTWQNYNPSLSPDGAQVAFHRWTVPGDFASLEIYRLVIATGMEIRLTTDGFPSAAPKWSPDGSTLVHSAWTDYRKPANANLFLFSISTWTPAQITSDKDWEDNDPAWCGTDAIVFKSTRRTGKPAKEEIYVVDPDGSKLDRLSTTNDWTAGGWESDHDPRCTPKGEWVYFYRFEATRPWTEFTPETWDQVFPANVWRSDRAGDQEQLTFCDHACTYPIPSKDGTSVGYLEKTFLVDSKGKLIGSTARFMVMDPDGSNVRELFPAGVLGDHLPTVEYWDW